MVIYQENLFGTELFKVELESGKIYVLDEKISDKKFKVTRNELINNYSHIFEPSAFCKMLQEVDSYV